MNIWFMLWVFLAVFILGTSLWSLYILLRQKRVWKTFAEKHGLKYSSEALYKSPMVVGLFSGMQIAFFSDKQVSAKESDIGVRTIIQIAMGAPMPCEGVIAAASFKNFVAGLMLPDQFVPDVAGWNKDILIHVKDLEKMRSYFSPERLSAINALMSIRISPAMIIFTGEDTILRIESSDPFDEEGRLERFIKKVTDAAKILSV